MNCKNCQSKINIKSAIEISSFSWPLSQMVWYECAVCKSGNHLRFEKGLVKLVQPLGSPGHEYEVLSEVQELTIEIRIDPSYLHIWYLGKHYEVKERQP